VTGEHIPSLISVASFSVPAFSLSPPGFISLVLNNRMAVETRLQTGAVIPSNAAFLSNAKNVPFRFHMGNMG
jgi:hypothetical protein